VQQALASQKDIPQARRNLTKKANHIHHSRDKPAPFLALSVLWAGYGSSRSLYNSKLDHVFAKDGCSTLWEEISCPQSLRSLSNHEGGTSCSAMAVNGAAIGGLAYKGELLGFRS
jgi:formate-dependent nitrite reductase cytochrome c552 subunit